MPNRTLYVGVDESNHGNKVKPAEVIIATFSSNPADSCIRSKTVKRKRNHEGSIGWLDYSESDYRFTVLNDAVFASTTYNLPLVAPFLIRDYITKNPGFDNIEIHLDGALLPEYRERLIKELSEFQHISASNFVKQGNRVGNKKRRKLCRHQMLSSLVHHADILANAVSRGLNVPRKAENHVYIPLEQLLEKEKEYASLIQRV